MFFSPKEEKVITPEVVVPEKPEQEIANPRVMLLQGNPSNKETLMLGQIDRAFSAIILSEKQDGHSSQDTDAKSILVALALNICNPELHTTIELQNPENIEHAQNAGVNDFITATAYQGALLAQSFQSWCCQNLCKIFIDPETYLQYVLFPNSLINQPYISVVNYATKQLGAILGLSWNEQIDLSPDPQTVRPQCIKS